MSGLPLVGWHAGNCRVIDNVDWRIMAAVHPELFCYLTGEFIGEEELKRIKAQVPGGEIVPRPYYVPQPYSIQAIDQYIDQCCAALDVALRVYLPERIHLKAFNEPNQPSWAQWEGFGDTADDQRRYNEAFVRLAEAIHRHAPGVKVQVLSLTDYRDVRCPGDDPNVPYWVHGPDGTAETCLVKDAIMVADEIGGHVYIHRRDHQPADASAANVTSIYYGLRYQQIHRLWPTKPIYLTEAGYPNPSKWEDIAGRRIREWLWHVAQDPYVKGVCLWMLGRDMGHNGHWRVGSDPAPQVYEVAGWRDDVKQGDPIEWPEPGLPSPLPPLTASYIEWSRFFRLRLNPGAALRQAIVAAKQQVAGDEFSASPQGARQYGYDPEKNKWFLWEWVPGQPCRVVFSEEAAR